jgi:hypothetical protein
MKLDVNGHDYGQYKHIVVVFNAAHSQTAFTDGRLQGLKLKLHPRHIVSGGHVRGSVMILGAERLWQTTECYIGCKQLLRVAVNDRLGIEPG